MATTTTIIDSPLWPAGTTVAIYLLADQVSNNGNDSPKGSVITSAVVDADSDLAFSGLAHDTRYLAAAEVGGLWVKAVIATDPRPHTGLFSDEDAIITAYWIFEGDVDFNGDVTLTGDVTFTGDDVTFTDGVAMGRNPSADLLPTDPSKWAGIDFVMVTNRGGGNRLHARAANLVGIDPPELVFRGAGPNNTAPFGPGQDGTAFEAVPLGRGLGRVAWQGLTQRSGEGAEGQGSYQGWSAHIGASAAEAHRRDGLEATLASSVTLPPATATTITVTEDLGALIANDGTTQEFRESGRAIIGGTTIRYAGRSSTQLFGVTGGGVNTAQLFVDPLGDHNRLKFTAKSSGAAGNSTTIAYVDPGTPSASLSIGVVSSAITVNLATSGSGAITTTANDIQTAIRANAAAAALVNVNNKFISPLSDGSGVVPAVAATNLAGGTDSIAYSAGQAVTQVQPANAGFIHFHTSAVGTNSRSERFRIGPEGSVGIGQKAIIGDRRDFFMVQGGQSHFYETEAPQNLTAEVVGTPGSTSITYKVVGNTPHGGQTAPASVTISTAPATLSTTNYVKLTWDSGPGALTWDVIRSATAGTPSATGCIVRGQRFDHTGRFYGDSAAVDYGQDRAALNAEQTVSVVDADGGQFALAFDGQTTALMDWDCSATTMQSRLTALTNIGVGDVAVTKVQITPPTWRIIFQGSWASTDAPRLAWARDELIDEAPADDDPEDIPRAQVLIRERVQGGPVLYTLPTRNTTGDVEIDGAVVANQFIELTEQTEDPDAPAAGAARLYLIDDGAGNTRLAARFATGTVWIATEP